MATSGLVKKQKIPRVNRRHKINEEINATLFCSILQSPLPDFIIIKDDKNTFCEAYKKVSAGRGINGSIKRVKDAPA